MFIIRGAVPIDADFFAEHILMSAPYFPVLFGEGIKELLRSLFRERANLFSFEHVSVCELSGKRVGMLLGYDWKDKKHEDLRTGFLLFRWMGLSMMARLKTFLRFNQTVGHTTLGDYYISNIAVEHGYRGMGIGKRLMMVAEREAREKGDFRIILDVEQENTNAINFYRALGYRIEKEFSLPLQKDRCIWFLRMARRIG